MKNAARIVKRSTAAAVLAFTLSPHADAGAPGFYSAPPAYTTHAEAAPYAGVYNYGTHARPYRYGWFGAEHFYPSHGSHQDYYGDVVRWSRWRRY